MNNPFYWGTLAMPPNKYYYHSKPNCLRSLALEKTAICAIGVHEISKLKHIAISLYSPELKFEFLLELFWMNAYEEMFRYLPLWDEFFAPILLSKVYLKYTYSTLYYIFHKAMTPSWLIHNSILKFINVIIVEYIEKKDMYERDVRSLLYLSEFLFDSGWYEGNKRLLLELYYICSHNNVNINHNQCQLLKLNINFELFKNCLAEGNISPYNLNKAKHLKIELLKIFNKINNNSSVDFLSNLTLVEKKSMEIAMLTQFTLYETIKGNYHKATLHTKQMIKKILKYYEMLNEKNVWEDKKSILPKILIEALCIASNTYLVNGNYEQAKILIECAVCQAKSVYGVDHLVYANVLAYQGFFLGELDEFEKSRMCFVMLQSIVVRHFGHKKNIIWAIASMKMAGAKLMYHNSKYAIHEIHGSSQNDRNALEACEYEMQEAYKFFVTCVSDCEFGERPHQYYALIIRFRCNIAKVKIELCTSYACLTRYVELMDSLWLVESSLSMAEKLYGKQHIRVARINSLVAHVYFKIIQFREHPIATHYYDKVKKAEEHVEKAKKIMLTRLPKNSSILCTFLMDTAFLHYQLFNLKVRDKELDLSLNWSEFNETHKANRYQCEKYLLQAKDICTEVFPKYSSVLFQIYDLLETLYNELYIFDSETHLNRVRTLKDVWKVEKSVDNHARNENKCFCVECPEYSCTACVNCYCNSEKKLVKKEKEEINYEEAIKQIV